MTLPRMFLLVAALTGLSLLAGCVAPPPDGAAPRRPALESSAPRPAAPSLASPEQQALIAEGCQIRFAYKPRQLQACLAGDPLLAEEAIKEACRRRHWGDVTGYRRCIFGVAE